MSSETSGEGRVIRPLAEIDDTSDAAISAPMWTGAAYTPLQAEAPSSAAATGLPHIGLDGHVGGISPDAAPAITPSTGQLWFGVAGGTAEEHGYYFNNDGTTFTQDGSTVDPIGPVLDIGVDTAAGLYFTTNAVQGGSPVSIEAHLTSTGGVPTNGTIAIGDESDADLVSALAVDPINHLIYVGKFGVNTAHSGILAVSYNPSTGALNQSQAITGTQTYLWGGTSTGTFTGQGLSPTDGDVRDFDFERATNKLYFVDNDNNYASGGYHATNGVYVLDIATDNVTQLTLDTQFGASTLSNANAAIANVAVDQQDGIIYFTTYQNDDDGPTTADDALWEMSINGGTATKVTLPAGALHYAIGGAAQGGLVYDAQNRELYLSDDDTSGTTHTDIEVLQFAAGGLTVTSSTSYSIPTLVGHTPGSPSTDTTGLTFNELPILGGTGGAVGATEQSASVHIDASATDSDVDGGYLSGATVVISGGTFTTTTSDEASTADDTLSFTNQNGITGTWNAATETLTLSGYATLANYQTALDSISYNTTGDNPTDYGNHASRTLTWTISDGSLNVGTGGQNTGTTTVNITGVDDAGVITATSAGSDAKTIAETNAGLSVTDSLTITDPDTLSNAMTVKSVAEADLSGAPASGISNATLLSYLTLGSGTASHIATLESSTDGWTFNSGSQAFNYLAPGESLQLTYVVESNDGTLTNDHNVTITINGTNDAPVANPGGTYLDIDEDTPSPAGATVSSLFSALFSDADDGSNAAGQFGGVAVTAVGTTGGNWQYEHAGVWHSITSASTTSAVLVAAGDNLRFLPDANWNGDAPTLTVHLADASTAITSGATADLTTTGGLTPYSTGTVTLDEHVNAVNDAPTIINGTTAALGTVLEDAATPSSDTVQNLFASHFSDATDEVVGGSHANAFAGVAVTGDAATSEGDWQYSTDSGAHWTSLAGVTAASAVVLDGTDDLRFVPSANYNGAAPGLTIHLIDDSAGAVTGGSTADLTTTGGTTQYSAGTITLGETITPVNDAPTVINGGTTTLGSILEDNNNPAGATVSSLFGSHFSDAADNSNGSTANTFAGIAVTSDAATASQGEWQYSLDGLHWTDMSGATDSSAVLVAAGDLVRFQPGADWNGTTPALTVHLIDSSFGPVPTGNTADVSITGGTTPYSTGTVGLSETVTAVNDAPTIINGATTTLGSIAEDAASPAGDTVDNLYGSHFSDAADQVSGGSSSDSFAGIVVTGDAATSEGAWQYFSVGAWHDLSAASDSNGIMIAHGESLRFLPAADWNGTTPTLTAHLVDSSWGTVFSGSIIDLTVVGSTGGTSAFSAGTIDLSETVTAVNDAPVVTSPTADAGSIAEDTVSPVNIDLTALLSANFSDAKDNSGLSSANFLEGIAVTADNATAAQGDWQYMDSVGNWHSLAGASDANAILVDTSEGIRFVPATDFNGTTPTLTVHLVDSSGGFLLTGNSVDLSSPGATGGSTVYSTGTVDISETVTAVNDAPTIINGNTVTRAAIAEDASSPGGDSVFNMFFSHFSDAADQVPGGSSANGFAGIAITGDAASAEGAWQYFDGSAWQDISGVSDSSALLIDSATGLRFLPAANWNGTVPSLTVHLVDNSAGFITTGDTADLTTTGGVTPYSAGTLTLSESVTAVNDAPTIVNGTFVLLPAIDEDSAPAGQTVDSLFSSHFSDAIDQVAGGSSANNFYGIAVDHDFVTSAMGAWQYSSDGGSTWTDLAGASATSAIFVGKADLLRFLPAANFNGPVPGLDVHLVDDSTGGLSTGDVIDVSGAGGSSPYSLLTMSVGEIVNPVNDAPTIINGTTTTLAAIAEDTTNPAGDTVSDLFASHFSDAANSVGPGVGTFLGIAVTGDAATSEGDWEFSTNGTDWTSLAGATDATAVLLNSSTLLRFLPSADFNGTAPTLNAHLIETGSFGIIDGSTTDLTVAGTTGGTSHISAGTVGLSETITAVNDAPVVTAPSGETVTEDVASALTGISFSDVDADGASETVTFTVGSGAMTLVGPEGGVVTGGTAQAFTLTGTLADINSFIADGHLTFTTDPDSDADVALGISISDGGATGSGGVLTGTGSSTIHVTAVNDAPTIINGATAALASIYENTAAPAGDTVDNLFASHFADADPAGPGANFIGILVTGNAATSQGDWQYSGDGGSTWNDVGTPADNDALELKTTDMLRFVPATGFNGTAPALTVHLADDSGPGFITGAHTNPLGYGGSFQFSGGAMTLTDTVQAINHAPSGHDRTIVTSEDTPVVIHTGAFGFSDADGNKLYGVKISSLPTGAQGILTDNGVAVSLGQVVLAADIAAGLLVYTPAADANGKHEGIFTFQVVDDGGAAHGGSDTDATPNTIYFDVRAVNDPPVLSNPIPDETVNFGDKFKFSFAANTFTDPDTGDHLSYSASLIGGGTLPAWLVFDPANLTFHGNPPESAVGTVQVEVTATDSHGATATADFNIDVQAGLVLVGTPGQDSLVGHNGNDTIQGLADNDVLVGGHGDDLLIGGDGNDTLLGGGGADTMRGGAGADHFDGGGGRDVVQYWGSGGVTVDLTDPTQNTGDAAGDTYTNVERVSGSSGDDNLTGDSANNALKGLAGDDLLQGGMGSDTLVGGDGNDTLIGGRGHDVLTGGAGSDHFVFTAVTDSTPDIHRDLIVDFTSGQDVVDLHALEPVPGTALTWMGTGGFDHHAGEVRYVINHGDALVSVDLNGDGHADLQIRLHDVTSLNAGDFVL